VLLTSFSAWRTENSPAEINVECTGGVLVSLVCVDITASVYVSFHPVNINLFHRCNKFPWLHTKTLHVSAYDEATVKLFLITIYRGNIILSYIIYLFMVITAHTLRLSIGIWYKYIYHFRVNNEELYDRHSSPTVVRVIKSTRMRLAGYVARMAEGRSMYRVLVGKPEGKRPLGRPRRR
jgi:hypothetical protein